MCCTSCSEKHIEIPKYINAPPPRNIHPSARHRLAKRIYVLAKGHFYLSCRKAKFTSCGQETIRQLAESSPKVNQNFTKRNQETTLSKWGNS